MSKRKIYMVQPNSQYGDSIYFPYAVGCLTAYAFNNEVIRDNYEFCGFVYKKENIDEVIEKIDNPFFVGFSCYVWNYEYNKELAKAIKKKYPDCLFEFGGHQINSDSEVVGADYVDFVALGEGEESFKRLLLCLIGEGTYDDIPNFYYKSNGEIVHTDNICVQIPDRVSPYLEGYFDDLVESEPLAFSAILETNRGCPNRCAFCDWGNIKARVKQFPSELIEAEIDWMSDKKIEYVYCADANFGLFPRDNQFIDYIIKKNNETGFPEKFQATYSKNNPETVFEINNKLNMSGMSKGATLSFQSMSQDVLNNIYRKNMPLESFKKLMSLYNSNGIAAYSELILGLPGESYESFSSGIEQLLECGQHMAINYFNCELLDNSPMGSPEYRAQYQIQTARTEQHQYHVVPSSKGVKEYSNIVVSTVSMSKEMWIASNIFAIFVRAFHNLGLLQCIAIYLYYERNVGYKKFYEYIIDYAKNNDSTILGKIYSWLYNKYLEILDNGGSLTTIEPEYGELLWPLDEGTFLRVIKDYDLFYEEISKIISQFFDDAELFDSLLEYQKSIVKTPYTKMKTLSSDYDFYRYYFDIYANDYHPLVKSPSVIEIDTSDISYDLVEYARNIVWFGRKGGRNIATNIKYIK